MRRSHARPPAAEAFAAQAELVAALQQRGSLSRQPKGTVLFEQNEENRGVYLLLEGSARLLVQRDDNRWVTVRVVGRGFLLGLSGTILNRTYLYTAKLAEDSQVVFVPAAELNDWLRERGDICFDVVELLGGELLELPPIAPRRITRKRHHRTSA